MLSFGEAIIHRSPSGTAPDPPGAIKICADVLASLLWDSRLHGTPPGPTAPLGKPHCRRVNSGLLRVDRRAVKVEDGDSSLCRRS